ncbi:MAG: hypothetical protein K9M03_03000 [Kiritimatiellales bacterium]|nr:hypothetical protein [Kiritimatiellales bacterium]
MFIHKYTYTSVGNNEHEHRLIYDHGLNEMATSANHNEKEPNVDENPDPTSLESLGTAPDMGGIVQAELQERMQPQMDAARNRAEEAQEVTDEMLSHAEKGTEGDVEKTDFENHADKLSSQMSEGYEEFKDAQKRLSETTDPKEKVKIRGKMIAAIGEMISTLIEFIQRVFNGTLLDDPNEKEENADKKQGETPADSPQEGTSLASPEAAVQNDLEQAGAQSPEEMSKSLNKIEEDTQKNIEKNKEDIIERNETIDGLQEDRKTINTSLVEARDKLTNIKQEAGASQADIDSAEATIKRLEGQLQLVEQEITEQESIRDRLKEENDQLTKKAEAAKEMKENLDPAIEQLKKMIEMLKEALGAIGTSVKIGNFAPVIVVNSPNAQIQNIIGAKPDGNGNVELTTKDAEALKKEAEKTEEVSGESSPEDLRSKFLASAAEVIGIKAEQAGYHIDVIVIDGKIEMRLKEGGDSNELDKLMGYAQSREMKAERTADGEAITVDVGKEHVPAEGKESNGYFAKTSTQEFMDSFESRSDDSFSGNDLKSSDKNPADLAGEEDI